MKQFECDRLVLFLTVLLTAISFTDAARATEPQIVSVQKIWDQGEHNAFTDLIRFQGKWWCTFREADEHGASYGKARLIVSEDGESWRSAALLEKKSLDLRDSKLSIMPDGRLMMLMGGITYDENMVYQTRTPWVSFSEDGITWTAPLELLAEDHWLWRATWHDGWAWSVSKLGVGQKPRRGMLYRSRDGVEWEWVSELFVPNISETTLRFLPDGEMVALTRPNWIGTSRPPYKKWSWTSMGHGIGGPNFIRIPNGELWASGRYYDGKASTVLARMTTGSYEPVLTLPSGGDCSYPGMVWHDDLLWMSYYSSHEERTSIYLAKIRFQ